MSAQQRTLSIPVEIHPCSWEGEIAENQHVVVVRCRKSKINPKGRIGFVLKDNDIHDGYINVKEVSASRNSLLVEPVADYVPHIWGIVGKPPRQFRVPASSIRPE